MDGTVSGPDQKPDTGGTGHIFVGPLMTVQEFAQLLRHLQQDGAFAKSLSNRAADVPAEARPPILSFDATLARRAEFGELNDYRRGQFFARGFPSPTHERRI